MGSPRVRRRFRAPQGCPAVWVNAGHPAGMMRVGHGRRSRFARGCNLPSRRVQHERGAASLSGPSQCAHVSREYLTVRILVRVLALEGDRKIEKIYKVAKRGEMHVLSQQKRAKQRADPSCYPQNHLLTRMPDPFPRRFCRGDARRCWYSAEVGSVAYPPSHRATSRDRCESPLKQTLFLTGDVEVGPATTFALAHGAANRGVIERR